FCVGAITDSAVKPTAVPVSTGRARRLSALVISLRTTLPHSTGHANTWRIGRIRNILPRARTPSSKASIIYEHDRTIGLISGFEPTASPAVPGDVPSHCDVPARRRGRGHAGREKRQVVVGQPRRTEQFALFEPRSDQKVERQPAPGRLVLPVGQHLV